MYIHIHQLQDILFIFSYIVWRKLKYIFIALNAIAYLVLLDKNSNLIRIMYLSILYLSI